MKKILFALLLTSHCFIVVNNTPITTTPTSKFENLIHLTDLIVSELNSLDEINYDESDEASEYSNNLSDQDSEYSNNKSNEDSEYWDFLSDEGSEYWDCLSDECSEYSNSFNNELFSACISWKSLCEIVSEAWNRWIKPLIIRNGNDKTAEANNERLLVMISTPPVRDLLVKYFAALNNTNLLSTRMSCKSFYEIASEVLRKRIKPLIIRNGTISSATDQRIFPIYQTTDDIYRDFLVLEKWQSDFFLNDNNPRSTECQLFLRTCLEEIAINFQTLITRLDFYKFSTELPHDAILIPEIYIANIAYISSDQYISTDEWEIATREAKLVIIFTDNSSFDIDEEINFNIRSIGKNHPVSICYAIYNYPSRIPHQNIDKKSFLIFRGSDVEATTFHVETTDEGELREKLLEWKHGLDFLKSHHIIAFHFTKELMEPMNSEEIFSRIFGIWPLIIQVDTEWFTRTGLIHINSTMIVKNLGQVFAIVGFKKF